MASFTERVQIEISTKVDSAKAQFANLKQSVSDAEGGVGKFKAAVSGAGSIVNSAASALLSPAGLAAGATAVAGAAVKAVGNFTNLGLSIGKVADATGLTTEQASRWVEVADDAGVSTESLSTSLGFMEKAAGNTPQLFERLGIAIAKTKDGQVDANQTFLNAIDVINGIRDPNEKAAAATKVFGRSWQNMAELVGRGSGQLQQDLAAVQPSKIFTAADVASARGVRDGLDAISDAGQGLFLTLGKSLAPAVAELAPKIGELISRAEPGFRALGKAIADAADAVGPLLDALGPLIDGLSKLQGFKLDLGLGDGTELKPLSGALTQFETGLHAANVAWHNLTDAELNGTATLQAAKVSIDAEKQAHEDAAVATHEHETSIADAKTALDLFNTATATGTQDLKDHEAALEADKKAQDDLRDSMRAAADAGFAVTKATNDYHDSVATLNDRVNEAKGDQDKIKQAYDDTTQAAQAVADAVVRQYTEQATANGTTLSATQSIDIWNGQMLNAAATASGPLRTAILDHIAAVNGIPTEKVTDIQAALDAGDIATAERILNSTSRSRTAALTADLDDSAAAAVARRLDQLAHNRTVTYSPAYGPGDGTMHAGGGTTTRPELATVGEHGREVVSLPAGATVRDAQSTATLYGGGSGTVNYYFMMPPGYSSPQAWADTKTQLAKRGFRE